MESLILGFLTGGSLILAIGPQNLFVIEQGLKKNFVFIVTSICAISDVLLIFLGIFIYQSFGIISGKIIILLNILLIFFLINFIKDKLKDLKKNYNIRLTRSKNRKNIILKTLGFTYLNPHVYSDTVFFLGNFSKNFIINQKILFGVGASIASFVFFFVIGYLSKYLSQYAQSEKVWKIINIFIISFMSLLTIFVILETIN